MINISHNTKVQIADGSCFLALASLKPCSVTPLSVCLNHRYRPEIPETAPSLSQHGSPIGGIWVFLAIKVTVICQVCVYCSLSVKINTWEMPHGAQRCILSVFVSTCVVGKNLNTSNWSFHGWRHHYTEWYRSSGISFLYLWCLHKIYCICSDTRKKLFFFQTFFCLEIGPIL